jgi:hypothetical protein
MSHYRAERIRCQLEFFLSHHGACNEFQKIDNPTGLGKLAQDKKIGSQTGLNEGSE